jgi:hypothetical protein
MLSIRRLLRGQLYGAMRRLRQQRPKRSHGDLVGRVDQINQRRGWVAYLPVVQLTISEPLLQRTVMK